MPRKKKKQFMLFNQDHKAISSRTVTDKSNTSVLTLLQDVGIDYDLNSLYIKGSIVLIKVDYKTTHLYYIKEVDMT